MRLHHCLDCWSDSHKFILTGFWFIDRCPSFPFRCCWVWLCLFLFLLSARLLSFRFVILLFSAGPWLVNLSLVGLHILLAILASDEALFSFGHFALLNWLMTLRLFSSLFCSSEPPGDIASRSVLLLTTGFRLMDFLLVYCF